MTVSEQIEEQMAVYLKESEAFETKGVKAAAARKSKTFYKHWL